MPLNERTNARSVRTRALVATRVSRLYRQKSTFSRLSAFLSFFVSCSSSLDGRRDQDCIRFVSGTRHWQPASIRVFHFHTFHLDFVVLQLDALGAHLLWPAKKHFVIRTWRRNTIAVKDEKVDTSVVHRHIARWYAASAHRIVLFCPFKYTSVPSRHEDTLSTCIPSYTTTSTCPGSLVSLDPGERTPPRARRQQDSRASSNSSYPYEASPAYAVWLAYGRERVETHRACAMKRLTVARSRLLQRNAGICACERARPRTLSVARAGT